MLYHVRCTSRDPNGSRAGRVHVVKAQTLQPAVSHHALGGHVHSAKHRESNACLSTSRRVPTARRQEVRGWRFSRQSVETSNESIRVMSREYWTLLRFIGLPDIKATSCSCALEEGKSPIGRQRKMFSRIGGFLVALSRQGTDWSGSSTSRNLPHPSGPETYPLKFHEPLLPLSRRFDFHRRKCLEGSGY